MSTNTLAEIDAELARLSSGHASIVQAHDQKRRQEAAMRRAGLEQSMDRQLGAIEQRKKEYEQLQGGVDSRRAALLAEKVPLTEIEGDADLVPKPSRALYDYWYLKREADEKLKALRAMVRRASEHAKWAGPRIAWAKQVEAGLCDQDEQDFVAALAEIDREEP